MKNTDLAYAAGAIDADGNITIRRTTQRMRRNGDCARECFSPRVSLGQVTPQVPEMLKKMFGGSIYKTKPGTRNSRPMYKWMVSDKTAATVAKLILPHLRIKVGQAEAILELHLLKSKYKEARLSTWFMRENPKWKTTERLLTTQEVADRLGYKRVDMVSQALANGTLIATTRGAKGSGPAVPRIPLGLVTMMMGTRTNGRGRRCKAAPQHVAAQRAIFDSVAISNRIGVDGTCVNHRTGCYAPAG